MILYGFLLLYLLLVLFSVIFFLVKKFNTNPAHATLTQHPIKPFKSFSFAKVKISRFITRYECPECGYLSMDLSNSCPHCKENGKITSLIANTMAF